MRFIYILFLCPILLYSQEKESKTFFQMEGSLMGQYNSFQANSSEIPATQFVFQANPKVTIYNMPLTANLRYVSGEDAYSKSMSQFNLGFDINTFKKNLMEKAMSRVNEIKDKGNLGELADLMYFIKKLYRALKVPSARLDPADQVDATGTTVLREELKFARFVIRQQHRFAAGIKKGFIT